MKSVQDYANEITSEGKTRFFLLNCSNNGFWGDDLTKVYITKKQANIFMKGYRKYMDQDLFDKHEK